MNKKLMNISIILFVLALFLSAFDIIFKSSTIIPNIGVVFVSISSVLFINSFDWNSKKKYEYSNNKSKNPNDNDKLCIIYEYKYNDLEDYINNIVKIYFNERDTERFIIYKTHATRQVRFSNNGANVKGYRYFDRKGNPFFDFDYPHGNVQYNHWHGWGGPGLTNRSKRDHWSYLELIWWMFGGM